MLPNIDPRQMKHMMRQMGISSEEIEAKRVVIECLDKNLKNNQELCFMFLLIILQKSVQKLVL